MSLSEVMQAQFRALVASIEAWGVGGLWAKLKVFISNVWARDEVQEVLDKSRDAVTAELLDKPIEQARKMKSEREKLDEERDAIAKQTKSLPDAEEAKFARDQERCLKELEIQEKEKDIARKEIENRIRSLEFVEKAYTLIAEGIIAADPVSVDINGVKYLLLTDGKEVREGPHFKAIADSEKVLKEDDTPDTETEA